MEKWVTDILGPYYGVALAFGALVVWWLRTSLRRVHIHIFAGIAVLAGSSFYILAVTLVLFAKAVKYPSLAMFGLYASAAIGTAASSALIISLLLISWRKR